MCQQVRVYPCDLKRKYHHFCGNECRGQYKTTHRNQQIKPCPCGKERTPETTYYTSKKNGQLDKLCKVCRAKANDEYAKNKHNISKKTKEEAKTLLTRAISKGDGKDRSTKAGWIASMLKNPYLFQSTYRQTPTLANITAAAQLHPFFN